MPFIPPKYTKIKFVEMKDRRKWAAYERSTNTISYSPDIAELSPSRLAHEVGHALSAKSSEYWVNEVEAWLTAEKLFKNESWFKIEFDLRSAYGNMSPAMQKKYYQRIFGKEEPIPVKKPTVTKEALPVIKTLAEDVVALRRVLSNDTQTKIFLDRIEKAIGGVYSKEVYEVLLKRINQTGNNDIAEIVNIVNGGMDKGVILEYNRERLSKIIRETIGG
jgi:hypothetical protein